MALVMKAIAKRVADEHLDDRLLLGHGHPRQGQKSRW